MKKMSLLLLLSMFSLSISAQGVWKNDKNHSQLKFDITHLGISTVSGEFKDFDVAITTSKEDFSDAVLTLTARTASINTGVEKRNDHLKSADFFDAATMPELSFKSTSIKPAGDDKYLVSGNLTMHGVTKPVTMNVHYRGTFNAPNKKPVIGLRATGVLKRADFGIGPKFAAPMLSEEVTIIADGEFSPQ